MRDTKHWPDTLARQYNSDSIGITKQWHDKNRYTCGRQCIPNRLDSWYLATQSESATLDLGGLIGKPIDPLKCRPPLDLRHACPTPCQRRRRPRPPQFSRQCRSIPLPEFFHFLAPNPYIPFASCFFPPFGPHMTAVLCAVITAVLTPCASRGLASPCLRLCPLSDAPVSPSNGQ